MFVEFQLPQNHVEGKITAYDEQGNEVEVSRIIYEPYFFKPTSIPAVLYASLFPKTPDAVPRSAPASQRGALVVSGSKGHLRYQDRTTGVKPLCEEPSKPKETSK